jgi:hypothetical protein
MDAGFSPIAVSVRTRRPTRSAWRKSRCRTGVGLARGLVGSAHLPEDLRLPRNQRIEAGGYAEDMQGRGLVRERVEGGGNLALREVGQRGQLCECTGLRRLVVAVREIELGAVARGQDHRFGIGARQPLHQLSVLGCAHEELLAQLDGRAMVGGADEDESHYLEMRHGDEGCHDEDDAGQR